MRRPPPPQDAVHFPATAGTMILALGITIAWWAKVDISPLIADAHAAHGQVWRLITSALPHRDPFHLAFNLYWLWVFGTLIERELGSLWTFALFGALAAGACAAEYALLDGGVGLSGIGYGLFGLLWVLGRRDPRYADAVDGKTIALFVAWFFLCIATTAVGIFPVANIAHGVGAILGALIGFAMTTMRLHRPHAYTVAAILTLALLACATVARPYINFSSIRGEQEAYLGYEAMVHDDDRAAAWWYRDATAMRPDNALYWFNRGVAEARLRRAQRALSAYKTAATLDPTNDKYREALLEMKSYVDDTTRPTPATP